MKRTSILVANLSRATQLTILGILMRVCRIQCRTISNSSHSLTTRGTFLFRKFHLRATICMGNTNLHSSTVTILRTEPATVIEGTFKTRCRHTIRTREFSNTKPRLSHLLNSSPRLLTLIRISKSSSKITIVSKIKSIGVSLHLWSINKGQTRSMKMLLGRRRMKIRS